MASITDRPSVPAASSDQTVTGVTEQWPERAAGSSMAAAGASILVAASMGVASAGSAFAGSTMSRASGSNSRAAIKTVSAGIGIGCAQPLSLASDVPSSFKHASPAMPFITTAALAGIVRMQRKFRRQKKYGRCWEVVMPSSRSGSESGVSPFMKKGMLRQAANSADDHSSTNLDQSGVGRAPSELSSSSSAATDGEQGKPKLPAASDIPLSIVPVAGGKGGGSRFVTVVQPGSQVAITSAATWSSHGNVAELRQRLSPGPLRPVTPSGLALRHSLWQSPKTFSMMWDYELMRSAHGDQSTTAQAEALVFKAYARFLEASGAPPRPFAHAPEEDVDAYSRAFGDTGTQALESMGSQDFQIIAKAHIFAQMQNAQKKNAAFPRMSISNARSLYANAMRFGHALRQAETRFQAESVAGTYMPLSLETQLIREELEDSWASPAATPPSGQACTATAGRWTFLPFCDEAVAVPGAGQQDPPESDADAAQRSLCEVLARLRRMGETRPNLATYLGWLGRYDPDALSMLAAPGPTVALAMRMQVTAVWGEAPINPDKAAARVTTTPSDMLEAVVFGAWLQDAGVEADELIDRHLLAREFGDP